MFGFFKRQKAPIKEVTQSVTQEKPRQVVIRPKRLQSVGGGERHFADATQQTRLTASWANMPTTVDAYINQFWMTLVARSRDQAEKSDHAKKFLQLCRDNIAGPDGLNFQSQVTDPSGASDTLAAGAIETAWDSFSEKGTFEITKSMDRAAVERLLVSTIATDGEAIVVMRKNSALPFGFSVDLVDPVTLDPTHFETLGNGNKIKHGIEFNELNQPVAYHFRTYEELQAGYMLGGKRSVTRIDAENVLHLFVVEKIGQKRGLPWMRTALFRIRNLAGLEDAAIINARVAAAKMGFFKDGENTDYDETDGEDLPMDAEPGTFQNIGDRELVKWDPQFPEASLAGFIKSNLRSIASGLGVGYNALASDGEGVNFSSLRQFALDEREVWKGLQKFFISSWAKPLFKSWLQMALLTESITVPKRGGGVAALSFTKYDKFSGHLFTGRRWDWIDPQKDMDANATALGLGIKSYSQIIRDMGRDPEDVWRELERDKKTMDKLGVKPILPNAPKEPAPQAGD